MKRVIQAVALAGLAALTVACSSGGGATAAPSASASAGASASDAGTGVTVVAKDIAFSPTAITLPADTATQVVMDNQEDAPHNILIKDAAGTTVFKGDIVSKQQITYNVGPLAAGSYTFLCEVHPNMTGTVTVQ